MNNELHVCYNQKQNHFIQTVKQIILTDNQFYKARVNNPYI